jgi:hypothetical protein
MDFNASSVKPMVSNECTLPTMAVLPNNSANENLSSYVWGTSAAYCGLFSFSNIVRDLATTLGENCVEEEDEEGKKEEKEEKKVFCVVYRSTLLLKSCSLNDDMIVRPHHNTKAL